MGRNDVANYVEGPRMTLNLNTCEINQFSNIIENTWNFISNDMVFFMFLSNRKDFVCKQKCYQTTCKIHNNYAQSSYVNFGCILYLLSYFLSTSEGEVYKQKRTEIVICESKNVKVLQRITFMILCCSRKKRNF